MSPPVAKPHRPLHVSVLAVVALGGVLGALARWGLYQAFPDNASSFPWTVFAINVTGSFLLALLPAAAVVRRKPLLPPLLGTGVLGGFTTLSTASEETRALLGAGHVGIATAYLVGTLAAALLAVVLADRFSTLAARSEFESEEGDL
ncbi:MAG: FluC/FEX family fluoride channel [Actinomycetes bacterium]